MCTILLLHPTQNPTPNLNLNSNSNMYLTVLNLNPKFMNPQTMVAPPSSLRRAGIGPERRSVKLKLEEGPEEL